MTFLLIVLPPLVPLFFVALGWVGTKLNKSDRIIRPL